MLDGNGSNMSETAEQRAEVRRPQPGGPPPRRNPWARIRQGVAVFGRQREATIIVVAAALVLYFSVTTSTFFTSSNIANLLSGYAAPIITIAIGWANGFFTVRLRVPSFITTLGTGFILLGLVLTTSHAYPASIPTSAQSIGKWIGGTQNGGFQWTAIIWAVVLVAIFHVVLTRTRWGLHTVAVGGNVLGAREAGIHVARIKYGNFMITGFLGAFVGLQIAFYDNTIDPSSGGYQPMFYAVTAAVIGGTAMLGGVGTILGGLLGAIVLATLLDGFQIIGVSANPLNIIFGAAILIAMIANVQLARLRVEGRSS